MFRGVFSAFMLAGRGGLSHGGFAGAVFNGTFHGTEATIIREPLLINGNAHLLDSVAEQAFEVNGRLTADGARFKGTLVVNGTGNIFRATSEQTCEVQGQLSAKSSSFNGLSVIGKNFELDSCSVQSLLIKPMLDSKMKLTRVVLKNTTVEGNVSVEDGAFPIDRVEVVLQGSSVIRGRVEGAFVIGDQTQTPSP